MAKSLYLDCPTGIAGDMFLAAMADAGLEIDKIEDKLRQLNLGDWQMQLKKISKHGLMASQLEFIFPPQHHHRTFKDICALLEKVSWDEDEVLLAKNIFQALAEAEAEVHGCSVDEVHFHEIGALDSILDICGAALAIRQLQIGQIYYSDLPLSSGYVDCAHGRMMVPTPATALLLKGKKLLPTSLSGELITPTGAAILQGTGAIQTLPQMTITEIGYGAGSRDLPDMANVLRVFIGEDNSATASLRQDKIEVLRSNIDDASGELLATLWQKAFALGALDMSYSPLLMKKARPAWALEMIIPLGESKKFAELIFQETTTLGIRVNQEHRYILARQSEQIATAYGNITIKISGNTISPEADEVSALAEQNNLSFKEVYQAAMAAYYLRKETK